jgi:hypothetical protein
VVLEVQVEQVEQVVEVVQQLVVVVVQVEVVDIIRGTPTKLVVVEVEQDLQVEQVVQKETRGTDKVVRCRPMPLLAIQEMLTQVVLAESHHQTQQLQAEMVVEVVH